MIRRPPGIDTIVTGPFLDHRRGDRARLNARRPGTPPLILVVDDHEDSRVIGRLLLEHAGYSVLEAANGLEALHMATDYSPAVVLLDLILPELDGWALARVLRADARTRDAVVIAVTAVAGSEDQDRALLAGCNEILTKPVPPTELLAAVRRYIGRATAVGGRGGS